MAEHGGLSIVDTGEMAAIEIENTVSELFQEERGVRQGSVLSPTLPHGDAQRKSSLNDKPHPKLHFFCCWPPSRHKTRSELSRVLVEI